MVFSFELQYPSSAGISCRIKRLTDNEEYQVPDQNSAPLYRTWVSCPAVLMGPDSEFFAGSSEYMILVSFDGFIYETTGGPILIAVRQPSAPIPKSKLIDVYL